jgi:hypothetical protein
MRFKGLRFSLRTLLLVMAIGPAVAYCVGLPTLNARRYAAALATKNYAVADRMCADQRYVFPGEARDWLSFAAQAKIEAWSWQDVWLGQRRMVVYQQAHIGSVVVSGAGFDAVATRKGIVFPWEEGRLGVEIP